MRMRSTLEWVTLACALLAATAAGCGDDDGGGSDAAAPPLDSGATRDAGPGDGGTSGGAGITEAECREAADEAGMTIGDVEQQQCRDEATSAVCEAVAACSCDNCICLLGACQTSAACTGILGCAEATGCRDTNCFATRLFDPACNGLTAWALDAQAVATAMAVGECLAESGCLDVACDGDGGT